jgi:single-strand DNA-binding protein
MTQGLNRVLVLGNVGKDPKYKQFKTGSRLEIRLATNEGYKDSEGKWVDHTEWHNVVIREKRADALSKHIKKGTGLLIGGKLRTRQWKDDDGKTNFLTEIVADNVLFIGGRRDDDETGESREGRSSSRGGGSRRREEQHESHGEESQGGDADESGGSVTGGADNYEDIPF